MDSRAAAAIGRQARLELVFEARAGRTVLAHAYAEPPFRIGRAFAIDDAAYLIVVCSGPGVFGGDALHQSVRVESGARVVLTSQSALQVHPAGELQDCRIAGLQKGKGKGVETFPSCHPAILPSCNIAIVHHAYQVADDAELHCHWDPVIPFADASLVQEFDLRLHRNSRLYWSDALMSGRARRGEAWRFRELAHTLRLRVDGSLKYLERYRVTPAVRAIARPWIAGDAHYVATTLVRHPRALPEEVESMHRQVQHIAGAQVAADYLEPELAVARTMSADGVAFSQARSAIRAHLLREIFQNPGLAGRK